MKIKAKLREGAALELRASIINGAKNMMESTVNHPYQTCLLCDHFQENTEQCKFYKSRPPARVIAFGCESFSDKDWIPF